MRHFPLATLTMLFAAACGGDAAGPADADSLAPAFSNGRDNGSVTVPMKLQADLQWLVDQSASAQAICDPRPGLAVGAGEGEATHMGRFRVMRMDHCSVDLAVVPPLLDAFGSFEWMAADGSRIYGSYAFLFLPPEAGGFFTIFIEGGTGRFEGATGRLDFDDRSGQVVCVEPLCLDGATWSPVLTGSISFPRP